jgi:HlyD family secretion protein
MRQRMAEALNRSFAAFRDTLTPDQRSRWDEELRALATSRRGVVWVLDQGQPRPVAVRLGASDGTVTEVAGELAEGDAVITGQERPAA